MTVETTRACNCEKKHRTYSAMAKCVFRHCHPKQVRGEGEWATVSYCRSSGDRGKYHGCVQLWTNQERALEAMRMIQGGGCCGMCRRDHKLARLVRDA